MARRKTTGPTEREMAILSVLWDQGPSTVREVHETLYASGATGYTTTLKLMQIMTDKGLLVRSAERPHIYQPTVSQERTQKEVVGDLLTKVFAGRPATLMQALLSETPVSDEELAEMRRLLAQAKSAKGREEKGG